MTWAHDPAVELARVVGRLAVAEAGRYQHLHAAGEELTAQEKRAFNTKFGGTGVRWLKLSQVADPHGDRMLGLYFAAAEKRA